MSLDPNACTQVVRLGSKRTHEQECAFARAPCAFNSGCGSFLRRDLGAHLAACPSVPCIYRVFGCGFVGTHRDIASHTPLVRDNALEEKKRKTERERERGGGGGK